MAKVEIHCPKCGRGHNVEESWLGRKGRCKKCQNVFVLAKPQPPEVRSTKSPIVGDGGAAAIDTRQNRSFATEEVVPSEWQPGDVILDLYEVQQVFESGGMGLVYKVHHKGWNLPLAVKSPREEWFQTEEDKQNFEREAETWVNLGLHPHIVSCYYVRRLGGIPRVFAEYMEGGSLKDWIESGKLYAGGPEFALERMLDIAIQFAWGLHFAHEQGLIHQDVKPANVLMTEDGIAKVSDFGLTKTRTADHDVTANRPGASILVSTGGMTPAYCSPEQSDCRPLSRRTDLWSWAVSILEMFTGDVTWLSGVVAAEALEGYLDVNGSSDNRIPLMPREVAHLLLHCFQRDPAKRPKDMRAVARLIPAAYECVTNKPYSRQLPEPARAVAANLNNRAVSLMEFHKLAEAEKLERVYQAR